MPPRKGAGVASPAARATRTHRPRRPGSPTPPPTHTQHSVAQVWKSYQHVPHEKMRQLSPFEIDVLGSMFRNAGEKFRHKVRAPPRALRRSPPPPRAPNYATHTHTHRRWRTTFGTFSPSLRSTWAWCGEQRWCGRRCCGITATRRLFFLRFTHNYIFALYTAPITRPARGS